MRQSLGTAMVVVAVIASIFGMWTWAHAQEAPQVPPVNTQENLLRRQVQAMERQATAMEGLTRAIDRMSQRCR